MNKGDLIEAVAGELDCPKAAAERAVNAVFGRLAAGLKKDREAVIVGFGSFGVKHRAARQGVNPRTGLPIQIKAAHRVAFRAGKDLKASL